MDFPTGPLPALSKGARYELLGISRAALESAVRGERPSHPNVQYLELAEPGAAFVTLFLDEQLKGCRGCLEAIRPLAEAVQAVTEDAALRDPRFEPITAGEVEVIHIEISVLGAFQEVRDVGQIEMKRHGLLVRKEWKGGLLLPQVPVRYGWDGPTFLEQVCVKANLPGDAWKDP